MATTTVTQYIPFTFDEIYSDLTNILGNDSVYEGSNLAQIITAMSYLVATLNVNTVANVNETFLPLARKTENVLETARLQSYESFKATSYVYTMTFTLSNTIPESSKYIIHKYDSFTIGSKTYYYVDSNPINIFGTVGDTFTINVKEGTLLSYNSDVSLIQTLGTSINVQTGLAQSRNFVDIPYNNVENNGIELFLTYTDTNGTIHTDEMWTKSDIMLIDKDYIFNQQFFRKDDITFGTPKCYFNVGGVGNVLPSTTVIKANILQTSGSTGGVTQNTDGTWPTASYNNTNYTDFASNVNISYTLLMQGADAETVDSVRINAPLFNNTANRVISPIDYISYCNSQPSIRASKIWGGDEEYPQRPGQVWFSLLPSNYIRTFTMATDGRTWSLDNSSDNNNWFVEDAQVWNPSDASNPGIWDKLEYYKVPTLQYYNRNPQFIDCNFDIQVLKYNTLKSQTEINTDVFNVIDTYFKQNGEYSITGQDINFLEQFNAEFFITNLIKRINEQITDASGFTINMTNTFTVFPHNLAQEYYYSNPANLDVSMAFQFPYEGILDSDGYLIPARLPNIDATSVVFSDEITTLTGDLSVDFTDTEGVDYTNVDYISAPIKYVTSTHTYTIGKYEIFNDYTKTIKITFWVQGTGTTTDEYLSSPLQSSMFATPQTFNISFYSPNFKVLKNTVPRLNTVTFHA